MTSVDDMLLFVQVVDFGSFSKVAENMRVTNSVISKRIGRLEESLNVQLLYRTTRRLNLTDAGRALYQKAKVVKEAFSDATDSVVSYSDTVHGKISIRLPDIAINMGLCSAIAQFCIAYPDIQVDVSIDNSPVDLIEDGIDLAVSIAEPEDSSLIARRITSVAYTVCATPKYLRKHGIPLQPDELHSHECILFCEQGMGSVTWPFWQRQKNYSQKLHGRLRMNNLLAIRNATLTGLGLSFLPLQLVTHNIERGELRQVLEQYTSNPMTLIAVYPKSKKPDHRIKLFVDYLRSCLK